MNYSQSEIETMFIGSLIASNDNVIHASDIVGDSDLTTKEAATSYRVIKKMFKDGKEISLATFLVEPDLKDCFTFLVNADEAGVGSTCTMYADHIAEQARISRLAVGVKRINATEYNDSAEALGDIKSLYSSEIVVSGGSGEMKHCLTELDQVVRDNMTNGTLGVKTGFDIFENIDVDYEPGHCWAYGGYTSVGKTALLIEQVLRVMAMGKPYPKMAIHSTEMKSYQLIARLLAGITGIGHKLILRGKQSQSIEQAKQTLRESGLKIYDVNRDFDSFANQCRKDKMQGGLDLVWADYLQNFKRKGLKGYELMADMGKDSLALPQELDITLFMLSQISISEFKEDSGGLAFKGGGELGESCDMGFWLSKCKTIPNTMMVEHRKNRHGPKKDFLLEFQPHSNRLYEVQG